MAINYAAKFSPKVDEKFKLESKTQALVNNEYDFVGAQTVKVYTVNTVEQGDYSRTGANRYGTPAELDTDIQEMTMRKDRSFTFTIDKMNQDETNNALEVGKALARQLRERTMPEIDTYRLGEMATNAGKKVTPGAISNIYDAIVDGTEWLDEKEVPTEGRVLVVTPAIYKAMKKSDDIVMDTETSDLKRARGVVGEVDGMDVIKIPASRFPVGKGFFITHPVATVSPIKLAEYKVHQDAPGISGALAEGRFYYDAFVLNNKKDAIYYHATEVVESA